MSLNKALELKPDSIKAWTLLGEEFAKREEIKEALKSFDSAAKVFLDYEIPYLRVAVLLKKLGERSQSDWFFKKAKEASIPYAFA
jgi:tetratricopeptide (TPR) repeat protein